jgi:hypothetical protein
LRKTIEVLYFDGCPSVELAIANARAAMARSAPSTDLVLVRIEGEAAALEGRFLGSPTIRVDGVDVDVGARDRTDFGLQCRVYSSDGHVVTAPPAEWIEAALRGDPHARQDAPSGPTCCSPNSTREPFRR